MMWTLSSDLGCTPANRTRVFLIKAGLGSFSCELRYLMQFSAFFCTTVTKQRNKQLLQLMTQANRGSDPTKNNMNSVQQGQGGAIELPGYFAAVSCKDLWNNWNHLAKWYLHVMRSRAAWTYIYIYIYILYIYVLFWNVKVKLNIQ